MSRPEDFVIKDGVLRQYKGYENDHIVIPDGVKAIGDNCFYGRNMLSLKIPDGVISIGRRAFAGCTGLSWLKIPDSVTSIGEQAFSDCYDIVALNLPANLNRIGRAAFQKCQNLHSVTVPTGVKSIGEKAFFSCLKLKTINIPDSVTSIGPAAFAVCQSLRPVKIPETLKSIGTQAFFKCDKMADEAGFIIINDVLHGCCESVNHITIPDGVEMINGGAFYGDKKLVSLTIPDSVKIIGESAFGKCENLASVSFPAELKRINPYAFSGCDNLKKIILPKNIKEFDGTVFEVIWNYFSASPLKTIMLCSFLNQINDLAVSKEAIKKEIKANKKSIIAYALENDDADVLSNLFKLFKKLSLDVLDEYIENASSAPNVKAFLLNYKNTNYTPEMLENYENDKFDKELGFKERTLSEWRKIFSLKIVDDELTITGYKGTDTDVLIPENIGNYRVVAIGERAFSPASARIQPNVKNQRKKIQTVVIPSGIRTIGAEAFYGCESLTDIVVNGDNEDFSSCDGVLFDKNQTNLLWYPQAKQDVSYVVPDTVKKIGERAFAWCQNITMVLLPESTKHIGDEAFAGCIQLVSVIMPDGLKTIGAGAFKFCEKLISVVLPGKLEFIGCEAFRKCTSLSAIVIPDSVKKIDDYAFYCCKNLCSIKIPASVTDIGEHTFYVCRQVTVYTTRGSFAELFAKKHSIKFHFI